ncbi:MAG TPA: gliding motility-associated C-terminal domain-containing protein [Bacteroidales bacterium]|nr:gliding motility-associated C-terminal domain-containing protein [Bacteroidales bacterium]
MIKKLSIIFFILLSIVSVEVATAQQYADRACSNDTRVYRVTGAQGSTFSWVVDGGHVDKNWGDSIQVTWNTPGEYTLSAQQTTASGCVSPPVFATVLVTGPSVFIGNDTTLCLGKTLVLDARQSYSSYQWNTGSTANSITVNSEGWYKLTVTDDNGCSAFDSLYVTMAQNPAIHLGVDTTLCWTETAMLDAGDGASYLWYNGSRDRYLTLEAVLATTEVWVQVTNQWGCMSQDTLLLDPCNYANFEKIPNTFTPNGDGHNDTWYIPWLYRLNTKVKIDIYDRWGQLVYHSDNGLPATGWDGTRSGKKLPMDSYYYIIDLGNGATPLRGSVTIIR